MGDGGSRDRGTTLTESRAVLAVVGPVHYVAKLKDTYPSIQDAEIMAVTLAMMFDMALRNELKINKAIPSVAYSDHRDTVCGNGHDTRASQVVHTWYMENP